MEKEFDPSKFFWQVKKLILKVFSLNIGHYTYKAALLCSEDENSIGKVECNGEKVFAGLFNGSKF